MDDLWKKKDKSKKFSNIMDGMNITIVYMQDARESELQESWSGERFVFSVEKNKKLKCDLCDL